MLKKTPENRITCDVCEIEYHIFINLSMREVTKESGFDFCLDFDIHSLNTASRQVNVESDVELATGGRCASISTTAIESTAGAAAIETDERELHAVDKETIDDD